MYVSLCVLKRLIHFVKFEDDKLFCLVLQLMIFILLINLLNILL